LVEYHKGAAMTAAIEGFYAGYFTGEAGHGLGLFVFNNGTIVGIDALGVRFDGTYRIIEAGTGFSVSVTVTAPAGGQLVQGTSTGDTGLIYNVDATLPVDIENSSFLTLPTPFGAVNVRLKKLRGMS
jgi:hypothetical protein